MYDIIVNPVAGGGAALSHLPGIRSYLEEKGLSYEVHMSCFHGNCIGLAREAAQRGSEGIIAVGGDGTLSETASGIAGYDSPMLIASCGTGNDYIKTLGLPADPVEALRIQFDRPVVKYDMGRVNDRLFINVAGTGLDVDVLLNTEKYKKRYTGLKAYLLGLKDALKNYRPVYADISIDGEEKKKTGFAVLSLGLGRFIGGGIKAVPMGDPKDGFMDLIIVKPVKKAMSFPCVILFALGLHVKFGISQCCRKVHSLVIDRPGMTVQIDGELIPCDHAEFEILPGVLPLRV